MIRPLLFSVLALLIFSSASAQAPKGINYQGVARDNEGKPIASKTISVRISILQNSAQGNAEYSETHSPQTNPFGLFTLVIGQGTVTTGNFAFVSWAVGNKWLQIEIDPSGGSSYQLAGSQQLMSVPYAFYAEYSGNNNLTAGTGIAIENGVISNTGDGDNSATNELITSASLTADRKLRITDAGGTKEVDLAPVANQSLTLSGTTLTISGGNSVNIGSVNTDNQDLTLNTSTNQLSLTNDATSVDLSPYRQTLTYTPGTNNLAIAGGNNVTISTTLAQTLTNNPNASGIRIQNVGAPTTATDATTKGYVDTSIATAIATNYAFKTNFNFINPGAVYNDSPVTLTDVFDDFNVVSGTRFTAPVAGVYSFTVTSTSTAGLGGIKIRVTSGTTSLYDIKRSQNFPVASINNYFDSNIYKLNAGDVVEVVINSSTIGDSANGLFFGSKL
ncbi:MAG: hypothetical protein BroJett042_11340 [Bacteroidota bacterium]|nr:MAG: hypothetical protein BroJett042_11340 [Bacteroidota bacterium]